MEVRLSDRDTMALPPVVIARSWLQAHGAPVLASEHNDVLVLTELLRAALSPMGWHVAYPGWRLR